MTTAEYNELKALKEKIADLQSKIPSKTFADKLTVKIGAKGTVNIYGLGRNPVCLYFSQLVRLQKLVNGADFQQFITENEGSLAKKSE